MTQDKNTSTQSGVDPVTISIGRLLRLSDVLAIVPISRSRWYKGIELGIYPQSVCIGKRSVAWRAADIKALTEGFNSEPPKPSASLEVVQ